MPHQRIKIIHSLYIHFGPQQHLTPPSCSTCIHPSTCRVHGFEVDIKERPDPRQAKGNQMQAEFDRMRQTKPKYISQQEAKGKESEFQAPHSLSYATVNEDTVTLCTDTCIPLLSRVFLLSPNCFFLPPILSEEKGFYGGLPHFRATMINEAKLRIK